MAIPSLHTPRPRLRDYSPNDTDAFVALNADPQVRKHVGGLLTQQKAEQYLCRFIASTGSDRMLAWAVETLEGGNYIGHVWLDRDGFSQTAEAGIIISRKSWGRGYGTEALSAVVKYARQSLNLPRIIATVDPDNERSKAMLVSSGYRYVGLDSDAEGEFYVYTHE